MDELREESLAGCCGLYCGLCPRFQSNSKSRCPGCKLLNQPKCFCPIFRCCVIKREKETCAKCGDYPCEKVKKALDIQPDGAQSDSFITHKPALPNLDRIRKTGLAVWLEEQKERRLLVEELLKGYNEGRSMSFYCLACTLMPPKLIKKAASEIKRRVDNLQIDARGIKIKAKILRSIIQDLALSSGIELKLRKKSK